MTFFQLVLSKATISTQPKKKPESKSKKDQKPMNYYYFGQNRFWYYTK